MTALPGVKKRGVDLLLPFGCGNSPSIPAPDCSEGIPFRIEVPGAALVKPRTLAPGMFRFYSLLFLAKPLAAASDESSQDESISEALTQ